MTRHAPAPITQNGNSHAPLTPDLLVVLRTLERMRCHLRPREIVSLADLSPEAANAAIMDLLVSGHVEIRFVELTVAGRAALEEAPE